MNHDNIIGYLNNSVWLAEESHMEVVGKIAHSILTGTNSVLREQYVTANTDANQPELSNEVISVSGVPVQNGLAWVKIRGTIFPRASGMTSLSGGVSAETLTRQIKALTESDQVQTILLDIDSPGGNVNGIKQAADAVRAARETKRVYAIANYNMMSAAYWIGSAAEKVFTTETSRVGSIGVLSVLQFAKEEDQERTVILRSAPRKAEVNPFEPLSEDARKKLQTDIDRIHEDFVEAVQLNRNISMTEAEAMANGEAHSGDAAVEAGMADEVVDSVDDVLAQIEAEHEGEERVAALKSAFMASEKANMALSAELAEATAEVKTLTAKLEKMESDSVASEFEEAVDSAISAGKIATQSKADLMADFAAGDITLNGFVKTVGRIKANTVVPADDIDVNEQPEDNSDPLAPKTEAEKRAYAQFPVLGAKYNL